MARHLWLVLSLHALDHCVAEEEHIIPCADCSPTPILFLHFHKSGGTSFLQFLTASDRKVMRECDWIWPSSPQNRTASSISDGMKRRRLDACMIERAARFPPPTALRGIAMQGRSEISVATMLRDPWARFCSNFRRDFALVSRGRVQRAITIEEFANESFSKSKYVRRWGAYSSPNYYVRLHSGHGGDDPARAMTARELNVSKVVLEAIEFLFVLEMVDGASQARLLGELVGSPSPQLLPRASNNPWSAVDREERRDGAPPLRSKKLALPEVAPPCDHYEPVFRERNAPDDALYKHALALVSSMQ